MQQSLFETEARGSQAAPRFKPVHMVEEARKARKNRQAFFTPLELVADMLQWADVWPGAKCLEPSAGDGRIVHALREAGAAVHAYEIDDAMRGKCSAEGAIVDGADFLAARPDPSFHFVVMNPPFAKGQARRHVEHAWRFVRPGGRLVAILPSVAARELARAEWSLPDCARGVFELLDPEAFKSEGASAQTLMFMAVRNSEGEKCGHSTYDMAVSCGSDFATYSRCKGAPDDVIREACLRYVEKYGGTAYGVDWDAVIEEMRWE